MIAEGQVSPDHVGYQDLPWKYAAGTPNILGVIVSAQALRLLVDLVAPAGSPQFYGSTGPLPRAVVERTMSTVHRHTRDLTARALRTLTAIPGLTVYGPSVAGERTPLVAFNLAGRGALTVAEELDRYGVEARAGCHCATLAHRELGLDPPASCRLSFYVYNNDEDVDLATQAVAQIAGQDMAALAR
jgi:cysteine desulfurase/selenocysteine lyase